MFTGAKNKLMCYAPPVKNGWPLKVARALVLHMCAVLLGRIIISVSTIVLLIILTATLDILDLEYITAITAKTATAVATTPPIMANVESGKESILL